MINCRVTRKKLFIRGVAILDEMNHADALLERVEELRFLRDELRRMKEKFTSIYEPLNWGNE